MIADCNRYVLSQDYPLTIIDVNQYILTMDTDTYMKNNIAVEQAFIDLPEVYKSEMANRLFSLYIGDQSSTRLNSNIEYSFPVLWKVATKELRQLIGKRFDKLIVEGNSTVIEKAADLLTIVDGLMYVSSSSRKILFEPLITELEDNLDNWTTEGRIVQSLQRLGSNIPSDLISRFVSALTLSYVVYKGGSYYSDRTAFFSNSAAPRITAMFEKFDNNSAEAFIQTILTNPKLAGRIKAVEQLNRLRILATILLNKPEIRDDNKEALELIVDPNRTKEFYGSLKVEKPLCDCCL